MFNRMLPPILLSRTWNIKIITTTARCYAVHAQTKAIPDDNSFDSIPGPSRYELVRGFLPGGRFKSLTLVDYFRQLRKEYGDLVRLPGLFGKRDLIAAFNPIDFETVFRSEGQYPMRRANEVMNYYRQKVRPEIFTPYAGLITEQGKDWAHFRSAVNPAMMNPKGIKMYIPKVSMVMDNFVQHIKNIRDPKSKEVPDNFLDEVNHMIMDSVCLVALDTHLDMINNPKANPKAQQIMDGMKVFFELIPKLELMPSIWKYVATPDFTRLMKEFDKITDVASFYINESLKRIQEEENIGKIKPDSEKSVIEHLVKIDRNIATVMALDMLIAGIDTTTSAFNGCLLSLAKNPEKQQILRQELRQILPNKNSPLTIENMNNLPYLRACIKEGFRYQAPVFGNMRTTGQDVVLSGYNVPKGLDIFMQTALLFRDEKYFKQPNEYLPERWLRTNDSESRQLKENQAFVFLPFGFGARICIGKRIVDLELEISLAKLVRNFEISFDYPEEGVLKMMAVNTAVKPLNFKFVDIEK